MTLASCRNSFRKDTIKLIKSRLGQTCSCNPYPPFRNYYAIDSSTMTSRTDYASFAQSSLKKFFQNSLAQWQSGHCADRFLEACYNNSKKAENNNKITQSARKGVPKSYFTQSIATISRNPLENDPAIFARAMFSEWWVIPGRSVNRDFQTVVRDFERLETTIDRPLVITCPCILCGLL